MKKHSKTGVESRFQGTVLGVPAEPKTIKIEGGAADSIEEWCRKTRERAAKAAELQQETHNPPKHAGTRESAGDVEMEME